MNLAGPDFITDATPGMPPWGLPVLAVAGVLNVACAVMLFRWMKLGFYGFIGSSVVAMIVNLIAGLPPVSAVMGLVGVGVLFGILQIGNPPAWSQLK